MAQPKILVTGATGKTGGAVVAELLKKDVPVRAIVRARDQRSDALDQLGVETVVADMFDSDQLLDAMRGTQRAYLLPVFDRYMIHSAVAFAVAAREARLEQIVQMGQWLSNPNHPALMTRHTWLVDQLIEGFPGAAHTIVNPGMFADNFLRVMDFASLLHVLPILSGAGRAAPVANEDMAKVIAAILTDDPQLHHGATYRPTGPELLSGKQMARIISNVVGHRVLPVDIPFFMFAKVARMQGVDPFQISCYRDYMEEMRRGTFELGGGVNDIVRMLSGVPAESFETTARRYAAMPFARQTVGNRLSAVAKFAVTPFYPGYNVDRWNRRMGLPLPSNPTYSNEEDRWLEAHVGNDSANPARLASVPKRVA